MKTAVQEVTARAPHWLVRGVLTQDGRDAVAIASEIDGLRFSTATSVSFGYVDLACDSARRAATFYRALAAFPFWTLALAADDLVNTNDESGHDASKIRLQAVDVIEREIRRRLIDSRRVEGKQ